MAGITLFKSCGFETADVSEVDNSQGGVTFVTSPVFTGDYACQVDNTGGFQYGFTGTGRDVGGIHCITYKARWNNIHGTNNTTLVDSFAQSNGNSGPDVFYDPTTGTTYLWTPLAGAAGSSTSWTPVANTWYEVAILWEPNSASGAYALWIDDTELIRGTGADFTATTATDVYFFGGNSGAGNYSYYDDVCIWTGLTSLDDYAQAIYKPRIHRYRSTKASATPDGPSTPTTLDAGTWAAVHGVSSTDTIGAEYTGAVSYGGVLLNDAGGSAGTGGPTTDTEVQDYIVCAKYIWRISRGGGGGTTQQGIAWASQAGSNTTGGLTADSGKTLDVSSQVGGCGGLRISTDGYHLYVMTNSTGTGTIYQYDLSTAFDLSTGSYTSKTLVLDTELSGYGSFEMASNGEHIYIAESSNADVHQYDLSTAWDLSTASFSKTKTSTVFTRYLLSPDGTKALSNISNNLASFDLATPYDVESSTSNFSSVVLDTGNYPLYAPQLSDNGRYLLTRSSAGSGSLEVFHLTKPFHAASIKQPRMGVLSFDPYTDATSVGAGCWGDSGKRLYVCATTPTSSGNGLIKSYTFNTAAPYSAWNTNYSALVNGHFVTADLDIGTSPTNYVQYSESNFPRKNEYGAIGVYKDSGGQDLDSSWHVAQYISVQNEPVFSTPRNVTCSTEALSWDGTNHKADVNSYPRYVTCATAAISFTENTSSVVKNQKRSISAPTATLKKKKGLLSVVATFNASEILIGDGTAFDGLGDSTWEYGSVAGRGVTNFPDLGLDIVDVEIRIRYGGNTVGPIKVYWTDSPLNAFLTPGPMLRDGDNLGYTGGGFVWSGWVRLLPFWGSFDLQGTEPSPSVPYTSELIANKLLLEIQAELDTRIAEVEMRVTYSEVPGNVTIGYFDGSYSAAADDAGSGAWINVANSTDGSESTFAYQTGANVSSVTSSGTTLSQIGTTGDDLLSVHVRSKFRMQYDGVDTSVTSHMVLSDSTNTYYYNSRRYACYSYDHWSGVNWIQSPNQAFWSGWDTAWAKGSSTNPDLTWAMLADGRIDVSRFISGSAGVGAALEVAKTEIAVLSATPPQYRAGGRAKKDRGIQGTTAANVVLGNIAAVKKNRGVNSTTEIVTLTEALATISFTSPRNVTCTTAANSFTESAATATRNRAANGATQALAFTENAAGIHIDLGIIGTTATNTLTSNAAVIVFERHANCSPEVLSFVGTQATVEFSLNVVVTCTTAANVLTENSAAITRNRAAISATESLILLESGSIANITRGVIGTTEALALTENTAGIHIDLGIIGTTAVNTLTASPATANVTRGVTGATDTLVLAETLATINTQRGVASATSANTLTENPASLNVSRGVQSATEIVSFTEISAGANRTRTVSGTTEAAALTESLATIGTTSNLDITCATAAMALAGTAAGVNGTRIAAATAEITAFIENASSVNTTRAAQGATETLAFTDNASTITRARLASGATEVVSMTEGTAALNRQRGVTAGTEAFSLFEKQAAILRGLNRDITCTTAASTLTENASNVNATLDITTLTEVVSFAENSATANLARNLSGITQANVLTESQATVDTAASNFPREVTCTTETLAAVGVAAGVNGKRIVGATAELTTLVENAAALNRTRDVASSLEALSLGTLAAAVGLSRTVTTQTEQLALAESAASVVTSTALVVSCNTGQILAQSNAAVVNQARDVVSATEALNLGAQASTTLFNRTVAATTENTVLAGSVAQVYLGANRYVTCSSALVQIDEAAAQLAFSRGVQSQTEVLNATESAAAVQKIRNTTAVTEVIGAETNAAIITRSRGVVCATKQLLNTAAAAIVYRGANLVINAVTASIILAENAAVIRNGRVVVSLVAQALLMPTAAIINLTREISGSTEAIAVAATLARIAKTRSDALPGSMIYAYPEPKAYVLVDDRMIQI
jgi:hypothetical protein